MELFLLWSLPVWRLLCVQSAELARRSRQRRRCCAPGKAWPNKWAARTEWKDFSLTPHVCLRKSSWLLSNCTTIANNYQERKRTALCLTTHCVIRKTFFYFFFYFCESITPSSVRIFCFVLLTSAHYCKQFTFSTHSRNMMPKVAWLKLWLKWQN